MSPITPEIRQQLVQQAIAARQKAYAPYSQYLVGAALMSVEGQVFTGCNVENAASPAAICAERTAVVKAVSEGFKDFTAIAVVTMDGGSPCGICRQVLHEFSPELWVVVADAEGTIAYEMPLSDLLPKGFGPSNLNINA